MINAIGGIGIFLLGMSMLTNGLKEIAGETLRKWLHTFTKGTFTSLLTGFFMTVLVQSSTATTILTVGFVSAGLISFFQSIGIIIGANIGSTSTGWIISLLGFKISLQAMSLPMIGLGVFVQYVAPSDIKKYGGVLTGFGLLFLGIDLLQKGMETAQHWIRFESLDTESFLSILLLIGIGIIMTIIMQASSAAMATTLTALFAGAIDFEQAAFLVVGQNIGTTATAIVASIGSSIAAKRTAATHLLFNVVTAFIVTIFIRYILQFVEFLTVAFTGSFDETVGLALFHTLFSVFGAIIFVPFTKQFSKLLTKMLPEKANALTRNLDDQLVSIPSAALEVAYQTLLQMMKHLTDAMLELIEAKKGTASYEKKVQEVEEAIVLLRKFLNDVQSDSTKLRNQHVAILHVLDHISRLIRVLREQQKVEGVFHQEKLMKWWHKTLEQINQSFDSEEKLLEMEQELEKTAHKIVEERRVRRRKYYERTAVRETKLEVAMSNVQALLWIDRLVYHYWRAFARLVEFQKGAEIEESTNFRDVETM